MSVAMIIMFVLLSLIICGGVAGFGQMIHNQRAVHSSDDKPDSRV
jgi:hypothetical protein